jgi:hypothetical protein
LTQINNITQKIEDPSVLEKEKNVEITIELLKIPSLSAERRGSEVGGGGRRWITITLGQ